MLWGWTTTSIWSYDTPNKKCASMTSRALFANVALSTVIFLPMRHVGCFRASSIVACANFSFDHPRNGPPDAVITSRLTSLGARDPMHCNIAECSLSTGTISPRPSAAARLTKSPAMTSVSLLASATRLPACNAASVASKPAAPTTAFNTMSTSFRVAASIRQDAPSRSTQPTKDGRTRSDCSANNDAFDRDVRAATWNRLRCRSSTRNAVVPIEPVEPKMATPRVIEALAEECLECRTADTPLAARTKGYRGDRARRHVPG